ncbi:HNH endonuclease signature motif containing protein [Staphylococcus chromogenes]|nr:HNH endonuclease signature motif containing protein [Staphylococcus chromogenes]
MTSAFTAFAAAHAPGMSVLSDCARLARSLGVTQLAAQTGVKESTVTSFVAAYKALTTHATIASKLGIPVDTLILVAHWAKRVNNEHVPVLLKAVHGVSHAEAEDHLRAAARELLKGAARRPPRSTVAVAKRPDFWGRRRITFHLTDAELADLNENSREFIARARKQDPTLNRAQALHLWLTQQLTQPTQNGKKTYKPVLLVPADPRLIWERGYLVTADGARVEPHELLKAELDGTGWALQTALDADGIVRPVTVAAIQDTRYSSGIHRMIAQLETLICSWPGCHHTAGNCQAHHIQAFHDGGETSWDNLTPLCPYHNGLNDDGTSTKNGRIVRGNGGYPGYERRPGDPLRYQANDLLTAGWRGLTYDAYFRAQAHPPGA